MAEQKQSSGSSGARLLIIIYGLALVAIGAHPIQKEYGGIVEYFSRKTRAFAGTLGSIKRPSRNHVDPPQSTVVSIQSNSKPTTTLRSFDTGNFDRGEGQSSKKQELDKLNEHERKSLNKLLDGL